MRAYQTLTKGELEEELRTLRAAYELWRTQGRRLNMARGKPGAEQLTLSMGLLDTLTSSSRCEAESGIDCRNYGELLGIPEARRLFGELLGVRPEEVIVMGSSSLTAMYDFTARAMLKGVLGSPKPWCRLERVKFLCPVPGYDRHFSLCESLGIEMISVPMNEQGPDMDVVEKLAAEDEAIKGIWCVPKFSNPTGSCYSDKTVRRLAAMPAKAGDFRIFWDDAYAVHYVYEDAEVLNILRACEEAGNPNRPYWFGSTSKITFPGAGVAFFAASEENIQFTAKQLAAEAISWDKLNMLRHVRFFQNAQGIRAQMDRHAAILRPRFDAVLEALEFSLSGTGAGSWLKPKGGYFITYMAEKGCAKRIVSLCREAGLTLTEAGATHPYHQDPDDAYIRIAPSFPSLEDLRAAMEIFCVCAKIAAAEKLLRTAKEGASI